MKSKCPVCEIGNLIENNIHNIFCDNKDQNGHTHYVKYPNDVVYVFIGEKILAKKDVYFESPYETEEQLYVAAKRLLKLQPYS